MAANYSSNVSKALGDITGVSQWQHAKWSSRDVAILLGTKILECRHFELLQINFTNTRTHTLDTHTELCKFISLRAANFDDVENRNYPRIVWNFCTNIKIHKL